MTLNFPALMKYDAGEEFNYGYSKFMQPIQLLYSYGMVVDDNKFAKIETPFANLM